MLENFISLDDMGSTFKIALFSWVSLVAGVLIAQSNPYQTFGYKSKVEYKTPLVDKLFLVSNSDTSTHIFFQSINLTRGHLLLYDEYDSILAHKVLDPQEIMTWMSLDPSLAKNAAFSPYQFCIDNPVTHNDPDGKDAIIRILGNKIIISSKIYLLGENATEKSAKFIQKNIMNQWSKQQDGPNKGKNWEYTDASGHKYDVVFDVSVQVYPHRKATITELESDLLYSNPPPYQNYIFLPSKEGRPYVGGGYFGEWFSKMDGEDIKYEKNILDLFFDRGSEFGKEIVSHEFGHLVGLDDKYEDVIKNGKTESEAFPGWENNKMGDGSKPVEQKNINGILDSPVRVYKAYKTIMSVANIHVDKPFEYPITGDPKN